MIAIKQYARGWAKNSLSLGTKAGREFEYCRRRPTIRIRNLAADLAFGLLLVVACTRPEPTPTTTPTLAATSSFTPPPSATPTPTATPVPPTLTYTPAPTATATPAAPSDALRLPPARALGSVRWLGVMECRTPFGDQCEQLMVTCPGIADAPVTLRETGSGPRGTVVLTTGGVGYGWYRVGGSAVGLENTDAMIDALLADGYRLVEVNWPLPGVWEGPGGSITLACRSATVIRYIYDTLHEGGLFIAQGNSGGNAQIAFALAYYGLGAVIDLANLSGGPPPCPISTRGVINGSEQGRCLPGARDRDESKEPMLSGDPQLHYPRTTVRILLGANEPTSYIIDTANAYYAAITSLKSMQIVPNTGHGVHRTPEGAQALLESIRLGP